MNNYIIISDRWSQDETEATFDELLEQAAIYSRDRAGKLDPEPPVTIEKAVRNGCDVIVDDTDEIIAVSVQDYETWFDAA